MRLYRAFKHSIEGLGYLAAHEKAFQYELIFTIIVIPIIAYLLPNKYAITLELITWGMVLIAEILNTAIEKTLDHIDKKHQPLIKIAKDCGSCAVLCALIIWTLTTVLLLSLNY